ncbi:MAG: molybdopterin-dependent oxidoreductase [Nitrospirae bacterium]|nr:molybdopterin-dependent oxidoreductase [Nitrospirota bacterium]
MRRRVSRRQFLKTTGQGAAALPLLNLANPALAKSRRPAQQPASSGGAPPTFEARYREMWTWDDVVRSTHNLNCWYQENCCFHVFSKNGVVTREEQVGDYPQTHEGVPDFNPRGCQKGCSYSELMYSRPRLRKPLKRVGKRGSGEWKEVSWDEALGEIADQVVRTMTEEGTDAVVFDPGGNMINQIALASYIRFFDQIDSVLLDVNCELGDDQQGAAVTYGEPQSDRSGDDLFYSDVVFVWGGNPAYTQIPNFHFLAEARYNGTRIVAISPDLNASAIHADWWVPVRPGTDAALALSMAHVVIEEGLYAADLVREQTDLPILVRSDNGKFLRESDMKKGGEEWKLYWYNTVARRVEAVPQGTLALSPSLVPALEGEYEVDTLSGPVKVRPVFEILKEQLMAHTPEKAARVCGVPADTIRQLARLMAHAKAATNTCTSGISKFYHGDLMMRAQILIFVLCGHLGRKGAGYVSASFLLPDGIGRNFRRLEKTREMLWPSVKKYGPPFVRNLLRGMTVKGATATLVGEYFLDSRLATNSTLFWNLHGGLLDVCGRSREWDPYLKRDAKDYVREALDKNWLFVDPAPSKQPRVLFVGMGNTLRRVRASHKLLEVLWPKLKLIVVTDVRMSSTALWADYVLPVSGAYEKTTAIVVNTNPIAPFVHTTAQAVENVGESLNEWEIVCALARKIEERAKARGIVEFRTRLGRKRRFKGMYDRLRRGLKPSDHERLSKEVIEDSSNLGGAKWEELKEKGYVRFTGIGTNPANSGNACDIRPNETVAPHTWHTEKKEPWTTLTGRVQFYIDHDWYLELGEALPAHKDPPFAGGRRYPLILTGGHTRWSIHSTWRSDPVMLRLQRGEPVAYVSPEDARARGVRDQDPIEVFNDIGRFVLRAKVSSSIRPGQAVIYHAWENYQFRGGMGYRNVLASPINPIELAGNYPYFRPVLALRQPGQSDRDTRIDFRRAEWPRPT